MHRLTDAMHTAGRMYRHTVRGDMIKVCKMLTNKCDSIVRLYLEKQQDSITRGHSLKLVNNRYHYDLRKFSFAPRIVNVWNSLTEIVISADTPDTFRRRLDKFWQHQIVSKMTYNVSSGTLNTTIPFLHVFIVHRL